MPTKLVKTDEDLDLGFKPPTAGRYRWEILDGAKLSLNPNSGKQSYHLPMQVDEAIDGDEDAKGGKATYFIPIEHQRGEDQMNTFINITGTFKQVIKKYGDEVDFLDEKVAHFICERFIGKFVEATHILEDYKDAKTGETKKTVRFKKFFMPKTKGAQTLSSGEKVDWEE